MSQKGAFIGLGLPGGRQVSSYNSRRVVLTRLTLTRSKKKKNPLLSPLLECRDMPRKYFNSNCRKSVQVGTIWSRSMNRIHIQIWGATKFEITFFIQHLSLHSRYLIKKGQLLIPYFFRLRFACWTSKIPKISFSLHRAARTSRMTWRNPFGQRSTQSAFFC